MSQPQPLRSPPRPNTSVLYAHVLPSRIRSRELAEAIDDFRVSGITIEDVSDKLSRACIEFFTLDEAERAYALLNLRTLPDLNITLNLSPYSEFSGANVSFSSAGVRPRRLKINPPVRSSEDAYDLIRPFAAIASLRNDAVLGASIQFWTEAEAQAAERGVEKRAQRDPAMKMSLCAYDPCQLFINNLSPNTGSWAQEAELRAIFEKHGSIISAQVVSDPRWKSPRAFVSYQNEDQAMNAFLATRNKEVNHCKLFVRFFEPPPKPRQLSNIVPSYGRKEAPDVSVIEKQRLPPPEDRDDQTKVDKREVRDESESSTAQHDRCGHSEEIAALRNQIEQMQSHIDAQKEAHEAGSAAVREQLAALQLHQEKKGRDLDALWERLIQEKESCEDKFEGAASRLAVLEEKDRIRKQAEIEERRRIERGQPSITK